VAPAAGSSGLCTLNSCTPSKPGQRRQDSWQHGGAVGCVRGRLLGVCRIALSRHMAGNGTAGARTAPHPTPPPHPRCRSHTLLPRRRLPSPPHQHCESNEGVGSSFGVHLHVIAKVRSQNTRVVRRGAQHIVRLWGPTAACCSASARAERSRGWGGLDGLRGAWGPATVGARAGALHAGRAVAGSARA
jgi:hypothetical protein